MKSTSSHIGILCAILLVILTVGHAGCNRINQFVGSQPGANAAPKVDYEEALQELNAAVDANPTDHRAHLDRAELHAAFEKFEAAMEDANTAIKIAPEEADAYNTRAYVSSMRKEYDEALADSTKAIELDPNVARYYTDRGFVLEELEKFAEALADYKRATELDKSDALAWNNYSSVLCMAPVEELRDGMEAVQAAIRAVKLARDDQMKAVALDTLGAAWAEEGNFEKAIHATEDSLKLASDDLQEDIRERLALFKDGKPYRLETKPVAVTTE